MTPKRQRALNLSVAGSELNQFEQDHELDDKENRDLDKKTTRGKDLYSFKRCKDKLHKYIPKTPFVEREHKRLKALEGIQDDSSDDDDEQVELFGTMFKTSDNKLDFTISQQQIQRAIENGGPQSHGDQVQELAARHAQNYGQFKFELSQGFSLLFYGYGSKQDLMLDFAHKTSQGPILEIKGYHPSTNIKQIFSTMSKKLELENFDCETIEKSEIKSIFIIIHNIEGKSIRKDLNKLAAIAKCSKIHLIASCDHINSAIVFDNHLMSQFKFLWHDLTTFKPYHQESTFEDSFVSKQKKSRQGVLFVLSSLPHNAQKLFKLLAESQLGIEDEDKNQSFEKLFRLAREGFVVDNQMSFRTLLTEFKDHDIITQSGDKLSLALSNEEIRQILDTLE